MRLPGARPIARRRTIAAGSSISSTRYAEGHACRMASLVAHFGDTADSRRLCGQCDFCSPERAIAQSFRGLTAQEEQAARGILKSLRSGPSPSTGRLYKEIYPREDLSRNDFDAVLGALAARGTRAHRRGQL